MKEARKRRFPWKRAVSLLLSLVTCASLTMPSLAADGADDAASAGPEITATILDEPVYTVSLGAAEHGSLSFTDADGQTKDAAAGESVTVTAAADEGFVLAQLDVIDDLTGEALPDLLEQTDTTGSFQFAMPEANVTVQAAFAGAPAEEAPDEAPAEDPPAEETPEETPAEYPPAEDIPEEEALSPEQPAETSTEIISFSGYDSEMSVIRGTLEEIIAQLPGEVTVTLADGTSTSVPAVWTTEDEEGYLTAPDEYEYMAFDMAMPEGYTLGGGLGSWDLPYITVILTDGGTEPYEIPYGRQFAGAYVGTAIMVDENTPVPMSEVGDTVYIYRPSSTIAYETWFTRKYTVSTSHGTLCCFCVEPEKNGPTSGNYTVYQLTGFDAEVMKAEMLTMYGGPLYDEWKYSIYDEASLAKGDDYCYALLHAHLSYAYKKTIVGLSASGIATYKAYYQLFSSIVDGSYGGDWADAIRAEMDNYNVYIAYTGSSSQDMVWLEPAPPKTGTLNLVKTSTNTSITSGNSSYSLAGAVYDVYADAACTQKVGSLTTLADGSTNTLTVDAGTYYVKEQYAPQNYFLDTTVHSVTVTAGGSNTLRVSDAPVTGIIEINKSSADTSLTSGNSSYSLSGAQFGVYNSSGTQVATLTTNASGYAKSGQLPVGTYTVREIKASAGYALNTSSYTVVLSTSTTVTGTNFTAIFDRRGTLHIEQRNVSSTYDGIRFAVWSDANGQDDLAWYEGSKSGTTYVYQVHTSDHPGTGSFNIHVYGYKGSTQTNLGTYTINVAYASVSASVSVPETPLYGYIEVNKSSSNPSVTNGNSSYSLNGAQFGVYSDSACKNLVTTLTTNASGYAKSGKLPVGTYTVREIKAPSGYSLNTSAFTVKIDGTTTVTGTNFTAVFSPGGTIVCTQKNVSGTYDGVRFAVWSETNGQDDLVWYEGSKSGTTYSYTVNTASHSGTGIFNIHVYGYKGSSQTNLGTYTINVKYTSGGTVTVNVPEPPQYGYIELYKSSSNPSITDGNACYSLAGAVYGVYSDSACKNLVTTLTTNASGYAKSGALGFGTYYLKETQAPQGYEKNEDTIKVTISTSGQVVKANAVDEPANDPVGITITKIQETANGYLPSLAGAQFTVCYYDTLDAKTVSELPATPARTWVIETKEVENYYLTALLDEYKVSGDEFYYVDGKATVPIGTITIQETREPEGYTTVGGYLNDATGKVVSSDGGVIMLQVTQDGITGGGYVSGGNYYTKEDEFRYCSITVNKKGDDGQPLSGAQFSLEIQNPETGAWDALETGTTDQNGKLVFDELVFGTYRITEQSTGDGHSLLAEPIVFTLPVTTAADAGTTTPTYSRDGTDYFCDVTFTVENGMICMPRAGSVGNVPFLIVGGVALAAAVACTVIFRKPGRKKDET